MAQDLLDPRVHELLERERVLLGRLHQLLEAAGRADDARRVADVAAALSEAFLVVIVGEFNSGKSSVVNALFGEKLMEEGPVPTTAKITLVRHGNERSERSISQFLLERRIPSDLLRDLTLVDTPGTNSIVAEHQRLTEDFIPRADLILFVTSYDRPLTQSEVQFLSYIRGDWGKQFVCVVNKADLARSEDDMRQVLAHVTSGIEDKFGVRPEVFPLSAALAYEAKTTASDVARTALWTQSLFGPFEQFVRERLSGPERIAIKLGGPLAAATAQLDGLDPTLVERAQRIAGARAQLDHVRGQITARAGELHDSYQRPLANIDDLLDEMRGRGTQFLANAFRVSGIKLLRNKDKFREEFQRQVVRDLDREIEARVATGVDVMQTRALSLWQQALTGLRNALPPTTDEAGFDRQRAFAELEQEAERQLRLHDVREEARSLLENAQHSADLTKLLGIGAAGMGVIGGVLIATTTADALGGFGIVTGALLAIGSLTFLPIARARAIEQLGTRMDALKRDLRASLTQQFERQVAAVGAKVGNMLAPLEAESAREEGIVRHMFSERDLMRTEIIALRAEIAA